MKRMKKSKLIDLFANQQERRMSERFCCQAKAFFCRNTVCISRKIVKAWRQNILSDSAFGGYRTGLINKITALIIAASIFSLNFTLAYAAPPSVTVDEALYINADYYGAFNDVSIVKGCSMNGITQFEDYGEYEKVSNMSNYAKPEYIDGGVRWNFENEPVRHFYFECEPKEKNLELPWTFDISYTLNGQPSFADRLAGASGLVGINIKAAPNKNAPQYYQNNMLLTVTTMVNMEDVNVVNAEGAQIQSTGTYKAVVFAGVPGEECNFNIDIGTDSFESPGIIIAMMPGTLDQMSIIKDLKKDKETLEDAADAIYDSLDKVLGTLSDMSGGLEDSITSLRGLDEFRANIQNQKGDVYNNADVSIASIEEIIPILNDITPHIENGRNMVDDVSEKVDIIVDDFNNFKSNANTARVNFLNLRKNVSNLRNEISDIHSNSEERNQLTEQLKQSITDMREALTNLKKSSSKLADSAGDLKRTLMNVEDELDKVQPIPHVDFSFLNPQNVLGGMIGGDSVELEEDEYSDVGDASDISDELESSGDGESSGDENADDGEEGGDDGSGGGNGGSSIKPTNPLVGILPYYNAYDKVITEVINKQIDGEINPTFKDVMRYTDDVLNDTQYLLNFTDKMLNDVSAACGSAEDSLGALSGALDLSQKYFDILDNNYDNRDSALRTAIAALDDAENMALKAYALIDDTSDLNEVINQYSERLKELLDISARLVQKMNVGTENTLLFARSLKDLIERNGYTLNAASETGFNGLINVLDRAVSSIKNSRTIRNSNDVIKKTVEDEIDEIEEDTKILDLDSEAERTSFTSDKNPAPSSIQIIIRTQEISVDDDAYKADLEVDGEDIGPWRRIAAIFVKLWNAIVGVFTDEE